MAIFTHEDFDLHYQVLGSGTPVLCIMGITANWEAWTDHAEAWSQNFQCILPDNRGVGLSSKPVGPYSSEMLADDYARLLDHLKIDSAHVIGCSMGSVVAQQLAIRYPEKVKSITLMCTWARCDVYAKSVFAHILKAKAHLRADDFMEYIQLLIFDKRSWDNPDFHQSMLDGREQAATDENPQPLHALEGQCAVCTDHDAYLKLADVNTPALVIGGEADKFTPRWMAEEVHSQLPNSELHLYPRSGHAFHWENLEDFNERVIAFIKAHE